MKFNIDKKTFSFTGSLLVAISLTASGCFSDKIEINNVPTTPATTTTTTTTSAATCSSSNTVTVDLGSKGTVAGTVRAVFSDTKFITGTNYPGVAYFDPGSLSLKYSFFNGSSYVTEVVAGDGTANLNGLRLVYLGDGTPIIFWTTGGTSVRMAGRSTSSTSATGTWTAGIIDSTTVASRGLDAAVNGAGEVGVAYYDSNVTGTGQPRFAYCTSNCSNPLSYTIMASAANINATNTTIGANHLGFGWCKVSSTSYYPMVVYTDTANQRFVMCRNSLSSCLTAAGWATTQTGAAAAATMIGARILSTEVADDQPKFALKTAAGITVARIAAGCATGGMVAWTTGAIAVGANVGISWFNLLSDGTKYHIVANEATTNMRYYNQSAVGNFESNWNTVGNIATTTIAAASTTIGGADINTSTGQIIASYGTAVAAANPQTLMLGKVLDYTVNSSGAITTTNEPPVLEGNIQVPTAMLKNVAIAATSAGRPAVAYIDYSAGTLTTGVLKYAMRVGANYSDTWDISTVPSTTAAQMPALAFDENSKPWISYWDSTSSRFFLATNSASDGSGSWASYALPFTPSAGTPTLPAANESAVAMYVSGGVYYPVVITMDNFTTGRVRSTKFTKSTGTFSASVTIETGAAANTMTNLSADWDTSGNIVIAYYDVAGSTQVEYNYTSDGGTTWAATAGNSFAVSGAGMGQGLNVKINPSTSKPALSFYDRANNKVYYYSCSGTLTTCATSNLWTPYTVEANAGVSGLAAATSDQLLQTGLTFTSSGTPYIPYSTGATTNGNISLGVLSSSSFSTSTLVAGSNGNLTSATAINMGIPWQVASVRTSLGTLVNAYLGAGNALKVTSCGD